MAKKILIDLEQEKAKAYERQSKRRKKASEQRENRKQEKARRERLGLDWIPKPKIDLPKTEQSIPNEEEQDLTVYLLQVELEGLYKRFADLDYLNRSDQTDKFMSLCKEYGYLDQYDALDPEIAKMLKAVSNNSESRYKRVKRLNRRLKYMFAFGEVLIFCTLTFSEEALQKTKPETRKQYVKRWCEENSSAWIANIDFGDQNEREHYHVLVVGWQIPTTWIYGKANFKVVPPYESDSVRVTKYISKFQNHAIKDSTRSQKVMYSRLPDLRKTETGSIEVDTESGKLESKHTRRELEEFIKQARHKEVDAGQTLVDPYDQIEEESEETQ